MKKVYLLILVIASIALLQGFSYIVEGITLRGWDGVNYGRILFPFLIAGISFRQYNKLRILNLSSTEEV